MYARSTESLTPFLTALNVQHGPKAALGRNFLRIAMEMRAMEIELFISRDVERLDRLGRDYEAAKPDRFPALDAKSAGFDSAHWFTLEGWSNEGTIAFVAAARCVDVPDSFEDEMTSFRFFYRDPERERHPDDHVEITAPSPRKMLGTVALQGAFWVNPSMRGHGLARIFPTACRWYCRTLWDVDYTIGFFHRDHAERGLPEVYGEPTPERWVKFRGRWNDDSYFTVASKAMLDRAIMLADQENDAVKRATRVKEVLETKRAPSLAFQGKSKRS